MRIEKNPGLGFSISGGISGQGNPFKPSDKVRSEVLVDNFSFKMLPSTVCCAELMKLTMKPVREKNTSVQGKTNPA